MKSKALQFTCHCLFSSMVIFCTGIFLPSPARADLEQIRFVQSLNDFRTHTSQHIKNVNLLGMLIYQTYKDTLFQDVPEHLLQEKLQLHDFEKIATLPELRELGYTKSTTFTQRLYKHYGTSKKDMPSIKSLIFELNSYATLIEFTFFQKHNLLNPDLQPSPIAEKLQMIEKIADRIDREMSPISPEEFGVARMRRAKAYLNSPLEKSIAKNIAKIYHRVVPVNPLISNIKPTSNNPTCSNLFN